MSAYDRGQLYVSLIKFQAGDVYKRQVKGQTDADSADENKTKEESVSGQKLSLIHI